MRTAGQGPGGFEKRDGFMKPGQDLVIAGFIGTEGTHEIGRRKREELDKRFSPSFLRYLDERLDQTAGQIIKRGLEAGVWPVTAYEYAEEGGVLAALWNLSGIFNVGIEADIRLMPIRQITVEICELYGLNPYRLYCKECAIMASDHGSQLVRLMRAEGIACAVIGSVTGDAARRIHHGGESAGYLERPKPDELFSNNII